MKSVFNKMYLKKSISLTIYLQMHFLYHQKMSNLPANVGVKINRGYLSDFSSRETNTMNNCMWTIAFQQI